MKLRIGSLFSGYGGLDMAVQAVFGGEIAWHCEWDAAPSRILEHHWPTVPNLHDVTEVDWATVEPVDILTGGYPCQPFSHAGRRKGTDDDRHLWPYVREAIRHLRPRYAFLENVAGHRTLGFDRVLGDLAEVGMHVRWTSIRASDVGAPHHRERLFILVANPSGSGPEGVDGITWGGTSRSVRDGQPGGSDWGSPADGHRIGCGSGAGQPSAGEPQESAHLGSVGPLPDAAYDGCERAGQARCGRRGSAHGDHGIDWGAYAPAVRRWERVTRPAPAPTEQNRAGRPRLAASFAEWMMGLPEGHVTDPAIRISRAQQLRAIGNGVCPQQATAALRELLSWEVAA